MGFANNDEEYNYPPMEPSDDASEECDCDASSVASSIPEAAAAVPSGGARGASVAENTDDIVTSPQKDQPNKQRKMVLIALASLILLVMIIALSVVLTGKNKDNNNEDGEVVEEVPEVEEVIVPYTEEETAEIVRGIHYLILAPTAEDASDLLDKTTPQGAALAVVREQGNTNARGMFQRYALLTTYFATDGKNWDDNSGWVDAAEDENVCEWHGVKCDDTSESDRTIVYWLDLGSNNLKGGLTPEICMLEDLQLLNVAGNFLEGTPPACLASMPALVDLFL